MTDLIRFTLSHGPGVVVETDEVSGGLSQVGRRSDGVLDAATGFTDRLADIQQAVAEALVQLRDSLGPDDIQVSFGVKFTAEAGAVIAKTAVEGHLAIDLTWHRKTEP
ncbi:CU044_2847 family protein [Streptomyces hiroshimensis]|uniref:Trypsin-co-occurring domain-containing protein n=1 Tax=Streptomyces hiroshimensis TaxID=66424 RepID=A0ABQ2Z9T5_9ACTN|nr:CU044_2847 family protein [Streptomyces hiroshimensis]GGY05719.1 hypothetical protein GCM10010324_60680 [Streptomyces hiroshimensis]